MSSSLPYKKSGDKYFDAKRVAKTIREICSVSQFVDPFTPTSSNVSMLERYLRLSKQRLSVVSRRFEELGYKMIAQEFKFQGLTALNAVFLKGDISDDMILFTAHHDYCAGLGAEDNATGLAMMLELGRCLEQKSSSFIFASFDLEELDLLGSRHFIVTDYGEQIKEKLSGVIALECLGSGKDAVICRTVAGAKSDPSLVSKLESSARRLGYPVALEDFRWFNSDQVPFAQQGIPTAEICSFNSQNYMGGPSKDVNVAHSRFDIPKNIHLSTLKVIGEILLQFTN